MSTRPTAVKQGEYEALAAFRYGLRRFLRFTEEAAQAVGLTPQQHQALLAIQGFDSEEGATVGDLAECRQEHHHSAVEIVDRRARLRLVRREMAAADRRKVFVRLTSRGETTLAVLSSIHRDE